MAAVAHPGKADAPLVRIEGLTKQYGLATVLNGVSFYIEPGEVHALVGENGAGKSTLARCLAGFAVPSGGRIFVSGSEVQDFSVEMSERLGIVLIHQELALAEHLSVAANMFLGHELKKGFMLDRAAMNAAATDMLARLGCSIDVSRTVADLPVSDRQMIEIGKALLRNARLIIMDEPTAVLTPRETDQLFAQIERLRSQGVSVIYVSHKLDEVKRISDRVTVLRDGFYQGTWPTSELTAHEIANLMVGRELEQIYPPKSAIENRVEILSVDGFSGDTSRAPASFQVRAGEILGVAGLVGSGRTELFESIVGLRPSKGGKLSLQGRPFAPESYRDALAAGVVYITEDRKGRGLLLEESIPLNVAMIGQILENRRLVDLGEERKANDWAVAQFQIDAPFPGVRVGRLSGGNQQKVLLAKSLLKVPLLILVDEPTRGIDVGTRAQIYRMLRDLANEGKAVVIISSDLQEIIGLSDRVLVLQNNRLAGTLEEKDISESAIVQLATGVGAATDQRQ
ncbi:MAG: sugar ABC transporter ATP-binding protein [Hyphomicrobiaceae bacterium]|nr:sugar ABC transporter ATP-binding protein [Hyphomicrobiaceae bacterium]